MARTEQVLRDRGDQILEAPRDRFEFGANWMRFLDDVDESTISEARSSLEAMLDRDSLTGQSFLDIGCGSGLFSLAARRMHGQVFSFDYDALSVRCAELLRDRYDPDAHDWTVTQGSVLDTNFMESIGHFDIVYSWGVLHHTGSMWHAIDAAARRVKPGGTFCIAIYNDQGIASRYWTTIKKLYNWNALGRIAVTAAHLIYPLGARLLWRAVTGRALERGMSYWRDYIDWLGGYPFEVATPAGMHAFLEERGFRVVRETLVGSRSGCNEFVFISTGR
jgi:2-polyprenyl-3-methyl-5-hydroxy-6-metoxy-1,4-benzoquinol methylase